MATLADIYAQSLYNDLMYRDVTAPQARYSLGVVGAQRDRRLRDAKLSFDRGKASLYSPLAAAGLENSGAVGDVSTNYLVDYTNAHDDIIASAEEARQQILMELAANRRQAALQAAEAQRQALAVTNNGVLGTVGA